MWDNTINILIDQALLPLVSLAITFIVGWAAMMLKNWTGIQIEAKHREALQSALDNGASYAINLLRNRGEPVTLDKVLTIGTTYVRKSVPDALGYFKLGETNLRDLLIPKAELPVFTEEEALTHNNAKTGLNQTHIEQR